MGALPQVTSKTSLVQQSWPDWRRQVVALIRSDLPEALSNVGEADIDWNAWRFFYDEGRTARSAVDRAFVRDF